MNRVSLVAVLLLASCQSDRPFPNVVLNPNVVEPLWSSYIGRSGGMQFSPGMLSAPRRVVDEHEIWKFDAASGTLISYTTQPARMGSALYDTPANRTAGSNLIRGCFAFGTSSYPYEFGPPCYKFRKSLSPERSVGTPQWNHEKLDGVK